MIYYTEVDGNKLKIEVLDEADGQIRVKLPDGRELLADLKAALGNDLFSLLLSNESHQVHLEATAAVGQYDVTLDGQLFEVKIETERQHRLAILAPRDRVHSGETQVKSPMSGLVSIVAVEVGQIVEQGQRIAILEAMKMENELRAPRAGTIKAILVKAGQTVEQNKVLAIIE